MDERTTEIIKECKAILDAIENRTLPLSRVALKARGLAQLVDDDAAFMWLTLECSGADGITKPERPWKRGAAEGMSGWQKFSALRAVPNLSAINLDTIADQARSGQMPEKTHVLSAALDSLERQRVRSKEEEREIASQPGGQDQLVSEKMYDHQRLAVIDRVAAAIHEWAANILIAHKFRRAAGNIFDRFKTHADVVLAGICPDAIAKLNNAVEKASSDNPEDWAAAAMSCRRVLHDFADAVYSPRAELVDGRDVSSDKYKNRLWAFAKERGGRAREKQFLATEEINGLCKTLDRVYDLDSKGVHADVTKQEAHLAVLRTYILLEQLGQLVPPAQSA